jgi:hypothetical protein
MQFGGGSKDKDVEAVFNLDGVTFARAIASAQEKEKRRKKGAG